MSAFKKLNIKATISARLRPQTRAILLKREFRKPKHDNPGFNFSTGALNSDYKQDIIILAVKRRD